MGFKKKYMVCIWIAHGGLWFQLLWRIQYWDSVAFARTILEVKIKNTTPGNGPLSLESSKLRNTEQNNQKTIYGYDNSVVFIFLQ